MEHVFVADTNLFFECKKLEDLSWSDLGVDPIVIALTKPVQAEIDKHKKGSGRTRRRALEVFARVRQMLETGVHETVIQEAAPRVVLRLVTAVKPDPDRSEVLDYTLNDDRIVGIVSALEKRGGSASVSFLTDDGGAAATASILGLGFRLIHESWKRPPQASDEEKEITDLKKDLAAYRAQEPNIELRDGFEGNGSQHVVRRVPVPLVAGDVDRLIADLELRHPMETDFSVPEAETWDDGTQVTYEAPSTEAVEKYQNEAYPDWIARCRSAFSDLHEGRREREAIVTLSFGLKNSGTRPASKLRITFEALGDISFRRGSDSDDTEDEVTAAGYPSPLPKLPKPPLPPKAKRIIKKPPKESNGLDIASLRMASSAGTMRDVLEQANLGSTLRDLHLATGVLGDLDRLGVLGQLHSQSDLGRTALGLSAEYDRLQEMLFGGAQGIQTVRPELFIPDAILRGPILPPKHNPEGFYFVEWPADLPVKTGGCTCDLFRHHGQEELFEINVLFPEEGDARGAIRCRVHAENLTKPVELTMSVSRTVENFDLAELAEKLIEEI